MSLNNVSNIIKLKTSKEGYDVGILECGLVHRKLAILMQYWVVTHGETNRHHDTAQSALCIAQHNKNVQ